MFWGDAVDVAQRIEAPTKDLGVELIATEDVLRAAFGNPQALRGQTFLIEVYHYRS